MSSGRKAYSRNKNNAYVASNFLNTSDCNYQATRTHQQLDKLLEPEKPLVTA